MVRQVISTVIGTVLFCIVIIAVLDYMWLVKVFNINKLVTMIESNWTTGAISTEIQIIDGKMPYVWQPCPVGMAITLTSSGTLICQEGVTIGSDCIWLDWSVVLEGTLVTGYQSDYNTCISEVRLCQSGILQWDKSFALSSCQTYTSGAQDCYLGSGLILAEHNSIIRRWAEKSDRDTACEYINMTCNEWELIWIEQFTWSSCEFKQSLSADYLSTHSTYVGKSWETINLDYISLPGGQWCTTPRWSWINDGQSVLSFASGVAIYQNKCVYNLSFCKNGILDDNILPYPKCEIKNPASCTTPRNTTINNGESITGYQMIKNEDNNTSTCETESRICVDGKLSWSYIMKSCTADTSKTSEKKTILPTGQCKTPRWKRIDNGKFVDAYQSSSVSYDQTCQSEERYCHNGILDGTFSAKSCVVWEVKNCTTPRWILVKHGESIFAYENTTVSYGSTCTSENRYCNDGILDGRFQYASCEVKRPLECALPRGGIIGHGQSVFAYQQTQVPYGDTCSSMAEQRKCNNGQLGGSYMFEWCEVESAADCITNRGTIKHGKTIKRFQFAQVYSQITDSNDQCVGFTLTCANGQVQGTLLDHPEAIYPSCTVLVSDE